MSDQNNPGASSRQASLPMAQPVRAIPAQPVNAALPQALPLPEQAPAPLNTSPATNWSAGKIVALVLCVALALGVINTTMGVVLYKNYQKIVASEKRRAAEKYQSMETQKNIDQMGQDVATFSFGDALLVPEKAEGAAGDLEEFINLRIQQAWVLENDHTNAIMDYSDRLANPSEFINAPESFSSLRQGLSDVKKQQADLQDKVADLLSRAAIEDQLENTGYHKLSPDDKERLEGLAYDCFFRANNDLSHANTEETNLWKISGEYLDYLISAQDTWHIDAEGLFYFHSGESMNKADRLNDARRDQARITVGKYQELYSGDTPQYLEMLQ